MKLKAKVGSYSSVVGGGVLLTDAKGRMIGQVAFLCHDDTLRDRRVQERMADLIADALDGFEA